MKTFYMFPRDIQWQGKYKLLQESHAHVFFLYQEYSIHITRNKKEIVVCGMHHNSVQFITTTTLSPWEITKAYQSIRLKLINIIRKEKHNETIETRTKA